MWQARYPSPSEVTRYTKRDGTKGTRPKLVAAPMLFETKYDATTWLRLYAGGNAPTPREVAPTLGEYGRRWIAERPTLSERTRADYKRTFETKIEPAFGDVRLDRITSTDVRRWHATMSSTPVAAARAYGILHAIYATAVLDDVAESSPCRVQGAQNPPTRHVAVILSPTEVAALVQSVPARYKALFLTASWVGLRFGELAELRRGDIDVENGVIRVRRALTRVEGEALVKAPKSQAGKRDVVLPPHVVDDLAAHLDTYVGPEPGALVFAARNGGHLQPSSVAKVLTTARAKIGRPTLRFHDLRHFSGTTATIAGATLREVQARLGHSTVNAAMRYQGIVEGRDAEVAAAMSVLATQAVEASNVTPLKPRRRTASGN